MTADDATSHFEIYSRRGCHLCDELLEKLENLCRGYRVEIDVLDVDTRSDWREAYGQRVPVLRCGERELCHYFLDTPSVEAVLATTGRL